MLNFYLTVEYQEKVWVSSRPVSRGTLPEGACAGRDRVFKG